MPPRATSRSASSATRSTRGRSSSSCGSVIGAFKISGAIRILYITTTGGRLFDGMSPKSPFIIVGVVNLLLMAGGMWLRAREAKEG